MKIKEDLKNIYNDLSAQFSWTRKKFWPEFELIKKEIEQFFIENEKVKILEIGCGDWRLCDFLSQNFPNKQIEYVWVDISDKLIQIAQNNNPKAKFAVDDMTNFIENQDQQSYDFVVAVASFQHIPRFKERLLILKNIYRILNYDWKVIMTNWAYSNWFLKRYKKAVLKSLFLFIFSLWVKKINDIFIHWKTPSKIYYRYYHIFFISELINLFKLSWFLIQNWEFVNNNWNLTKQRKDARNSFFVWVKTI